MRERGGTVVDERVERALHDLGGPLTVIRGLCFALGRAEADPSRRRQLRLIDAEVERIGRAVAQLSASPDDRGGPRRVDVAELVRETGERHGPAAEARGCALRVAAEAPQPVRGSADRLRRALDNLVANAVRHAASGGAVQVRADRRGPEVRVTVSDDGPGIRAADRARIFRAHQRGVGARGPGSGLGLAIAREVALEHGGGLALLPDADGARFRLWLPHADPGSGRAAA